MQPTPARWMFSDPAGLLRARGCCRPRLAPTQLFSFAHGYRPLVAMCPLRQATGQFISSDGFFLILKVTYFFIKNLEEKKEEK